MHRVVRCLLLLSVGVPAFADEPAGPATDDPLAALIAESHHAMTLSDEGLAGPGAELLREAAAQSQFLLIGESHGNVETPALTAALARALRSVGYAVLAVEVGPVSARKLEELASRPDAMEAFQEFHERLPLTLPFFFWREEVAMLIEGRKLGYRVWGLDQEFIASARYLLGELDRLVEGEPAKRRVAEWRETADEGFRVFQQSGDDSKGFLTTIAPEELAAFAETLPAEADVAREIVEELRQSAIVYRHFREKRYYLNNYDRIRLMKRHLARYIADAGGLESVPKAIFKFGSVHLGRGYSPLHQLDLGNAAAELAAARFSDSFHLNVSTVASVGPDGVRKEWAEESPYLARFSRYLEEGKWGVFDLRGLRRYFAAERNRGAEPEIAELVFRYDALALAPLFHAAEPMIDLPF